VTVLRLREAVQDAEVKALLEYPCLPPDIRSTEAAGPDRQMSARDASTRSARMGRVHFSAPASVAALWRQTLAEVRRVEGGCLFDWQAVSRVLEAFMSTWDDETSRKKRREHRIMERDGWQCTVPACSSKRDLHAHHVRFRSQGGEDEEWNLTTLCVGHHLHAVHGPAAGTVRVSGRAPYGLRWEMGGGLGGPPAFVFEGERCVRRMRQPSREESGLATTTEGLCPLSRA